MKDFYSVILRPIQTEKSSALEEVGDRKTFEVATWATKVQIKIAVEKLFGVPVESVRTMMVHGKNKRVGRNAIKRSNWKKAIVKLPQGRRIQVNQVQ